MKIVFTQEVFGVSPTPLNTPIDLDVNTATYWVGRGLAEEVKEEVRTASKSFKANTANRPK